MEESRKHYAPNLLALAAAMVLSGAAMASGIGSEPWMLGNRPYLPPPATRSTLKKSPPQKPPRESLSDGQARRNRAREAWRHRPREDELGEDPRKRRGIDIRLFVHDGWRTRNRFRRVRTAWPHCAMLVPRDGQGCEGIRRRQSPLFAPKPTQPRGRRPFRERGGVRFLRKGNDRRAVR